MLAAMVKRALTTANSVCGVMDRRDDVDMAANTALVALKVALYDESLTTCSRIMMSSHCCISLGRTLPSSAGTVSRLSVVPFGQNTDILATPRKSPLGN
jgi:hypothetical protein